jgi:hypothetical protein
MLILLSKSRSKNKLHDVTGMLVFDGSSFLQVLEGEEKTINQLFLNIIEDGHHSNIVKIISEAIRERRFSSWTMGFSEISRQELVKIDGANDFFTEKTCLVNIKAGRAIKILDAFAKGRWRVL